MLSKRFYRYHFLRMVRQKGSAENLGFSVAVGVFVGFFVPVGGQIIIAFFLALIFKLNKLLALGGVWVTNPLTIVPLYILYFKLGSFITGVDVLKYIRIFEKGNITWDLFLTFGREGLYVFFVGAFVIAVLGSIIMYFITFWVVTKYRCRKINEITL